MPRSSELRRGPSSRRPRCPSRRDRRNGRTPGRPAPGRPGSGSRCRTAPSSRTTGVSQTGQRSGISNSRSAPVRRSTIGRTTSGMTSPAFWSTTAVADPDVLAPHLVEVVEGRPGDRRARDLDRRQVRDRRQRPGPADVRDDVLDERLDLLGRELEGDRPARRPADHPEPRLLVEAVDLDDDAVGLVRQVVARLAPALGEGDDALDVEPGLVVGVDREAEAREPRERLGLGRRGRVVLDQLVEPGRQLAAGRDRGSIWRSDPAPLLRGLAYSGRPASSRSSLMRLNSALGMKTSPRASSETGSGRRAGIDGDRPQVRGHVLAGRAVAAGRALHEPAALVAQADREAVDLELGHVAQLGRGLGRGRQARGPCGRARRTHAARRG